MAEGIVKQGEVDPVRMVWYKGILSLAKRSGLLEKEGASPAIGVFFSVVGSLRFEHEGHENALNRKPGGVMTMKAILICMSIVLLSVSSGFAQNITDNHPIVILGDSQMIGFDNFPELFPSSTINLAVGGSTSTQTITVAQKAASYEPSSIFILTGTTNLLSGDIDSIPKDYNTILTSIRSISPATKVYALALIPESADMKQIISSVNTSIRNTVIGHPNAVFLDFTPSFSAPDGSLKTEFLNDGIHMNKSGYQLWSQLLRPYF